MKLLYKNSPWGLLSVLASAETSFSTASPPSEECYSVSSDYILSHLLSCSQLLFYLEIVLTNCTVPISEKNCIKLSGLLFIFFLEVLPVLLSRETVSFGVMVTQNWGGISPPLVPSLCTEHTFTFGTILELHLIFTSLPIQSSSTFLLLSFYLYSWGSVILIFFATVFLNSDLLFSLLISFSI